MEKFLKMRTAALFLAVMCVGFTSCGDDNDDPGGGNGTPGVVNPSNVFTGEMPKSVAGATIDRNSEGLVTEIRTADGKVITFDYPPKSRAAEASDNVKMTVVGDDWKTEYDMTIGSNGFVSESYVKTTANNPNENEEGEWAFTYDGQGHLTNARHRYTDVQGEGKYSVTLQWKDDNIIKTFKSNGDWDNYTYMYTSSDYPTAIENKGAIFMFEDIYPVEVYDFEWVYYAGMLGKGPKNLAVACYEYDDKDELCEFIWTLNPNGYPTMFDVKDDDHPGESTVKFTWN